MWEGVKGFVGLDVDERGGSNRMNDHTVIRAFKDKLFFHPFFGGFMGTRID